MIPRHPSQLYEAILYLIIFGILLFLYKNKAQKLSDGFMFGCFLVMLFTTRFLIEFVKEDQVAFENNWPINMGQILSIPFILIGFYLVASKSNSNKKVEEKTDI